MDILDRRTRTNCLVLKLLYPKGKRAADASKLKTEWLTRVHRQAISSLGAEDVCLVVLDNEMNVFVKFYIDSINS